MTSATSFQVRIERINMAHGRQPERRRRPQVSDIDMETGTRRGLYDDLREQGTRRSGGGAMWIAVIAGLVFGFLAGLLLIGVTTDGSPIGPGTQFSHELFLAALAGLGLSPLLMLNALFRQGRAPRQAVFALAYLSGLILTLVL